MDIHFGNEKHLTNGNNFGSPIVDLNQKMFSLV